LEIEDWRIFESGDCLVNPSFPNPPFVNSKRCLVGEAVKQLGLYEGEVARPRPARPVTPVTRVCAGCREREARYGFRDEHRAERPRTLCFDCFRMELTRRQDAAARMARGWNAEQAQLPLTDILEDATRRRRRAQIAARHALGL
jgi:hypothetical protein